MKYKWLLFDIDGTLFDYDRSEVMALRQTFNDFDAEYKDEYLEVYHSINSELWKRFELGTIEVEKLKIERFEYLLKEAGEEKDASAFSKKYLFNLSNCSYLLDGVEDLLQQLKGQFKMMLITNGLKSVQRPRLKQSSIESFFEDIVISEEVGSAKPAEEIFNVAFKKMNMPQKKDVLIIGDSLTSDIQGGVNYGIDTCWLNSAGLGSNGLNPTYTIDEIIKLKDIILA